MGLDIGYDFRETSGFVSDPAGCVGWFGEAYPVVKGGQSAGWSASVTSTCRDRSNAVDPRIAGINFVTAAGTYFEADVPAGTYTVHCAVGDPITSGSGGNWDFYDDATLLFSVAGNGSGFTDAMGNTWSAANWPLSEVGRDNVVIASGKLKVVSHDSNVNCLAHVRLVQSTSPPAGATDYAAGFQGEGLTDYVASF